MKINRVGIDLAKNVFQVHAVDGRGKLVWKRQLKRSNWLRVLVERIDTDCEIGMEACGGAHYWARELRSRGYQVKLMPPQFVKPYVKGNKNDASDASAICEAMGREDMTYVAVKTVAQQDIQAVHRVRASVMGRRTASSNQIRGLVAEYGLVAPKDLKPLRRAIPDWLEDAENGLTAQFRRLLHELWQELLRLDERVVALDREIAVIAETHVDAKRLLKLRGVGPLVARFGDASHFKRGRQAAASVGLTPRHHGTGGKNRIYGLSKEGDRYLRSILIHGARAVVSQAKRRDDRLSLWVTDLKERSHMNVAAVALANKTVRMAWSMLRNGTDYEPELAARERYRGWTMK